MTSVPAVSHFELKAKTQSEFKNHLKISDHHDEWRPGRSPSHQRVRVREIPLLSFINNPSSRLKRSMSNHLS